MYDTLLRTIRQYKLISSDHWVIVGVSGGADSLALLHCLLRLRSVFNFKLHTATLNHGLRGQDGKDDTLFVAELCQQWSVSCSVGEVDVRALAKDEKMGIEAAARKARYDFLASVAGQFEGAIIATAHHQDDQAETVLMRILRGTGLKGLGGMPLSGVVPGHPQRILIRPMLYVTRKQVEDYCKDHQLTPRQDTTNQDTTLLRNALRLQVMPQLQQFNPQISRSLARLADSAAADEDFIHSVFMKIVWPHAVLSDDRVLFWRAQFLALHPAMQRRLLLHAAQAIRVGQEEVGLERILAAVEHAREGRVGSMIEFPGNLRLRVDYDHFVLEKAQAPLSSMWLRLPPGTQLSLQFPGLTTTLDWKILLSAEPPKQYAARLNFASGAHAMLRTRHPGDRFAPPGLGGHSQKLKKWLIDRKIPQHIRDSIPLLTINGEIAAIILEDEWIISHNFAVTEASKSIIYVAIQT